MSKKQKRLEISAVEIFKGDGLPRTIEVDFFYTEDEAKLYLIEINTLPEVYEYQHVSTAVGSHGHRPANPARQLSWRLRSIRMMRNGEIDTA